MKDLKKEVINLERQLKTLNQPDRLVSNGSERRGRSSLASVSSTGSFPEKRDLQSSTTSSANVEVNTHHFWLFETI